MGTAKKGEVIEVLAESVDTFGRPSKLTLEVIAKAWKYLKDTESISPTAGGLIPTKERLALELGVHRETMDQWAKKNKDFSDILLTLERMQADRLIQYGLVGKYNPVITKLMLSKHGYVEKTEQDTNLKVVSPIMNIEGSDAVPGNDSDD